jgi:hypothetical protein
MSIPAFTADRSLYGPAGYDDTSRSRSVKWSPDSAQRLAQTIQPAFVCDPFFCQCSGIPDCDSMFTTPGLCGTQASCTGDTCTCFRFG